MNSKGYQVIIAGAGIAGSALALGLARRGFKVALIEPVHRSADLPLAVTEPSEIDLRVSALSPASIRLLDEFGVWRQIPDNAKGSYQFMQVWDSEGSGEIRFDAAQIGQPILGTIVENRWLVSSLLKAFYQQENADLINPGAVTGFCSDLIDDRVKVDVATDVQIVYTASLLVGADGADSPIRKIAGIECEDSDYGQQALVATVQHDQSHRNTAWQRFLPEGPLAFLPLAYFDGCHTSSIVWSADNPRAQALAQMDDGQFSDELGRAIGHKLGNISWLSRRAAFPLRQRHARRYACPGIALVADAAHVVHPLAGQGINLGLTDVAVLIEELDRARRLGLALGSMAVVGRYQRRRRSQNTLMAASMGGFQRLFANDSLIAMLARNAGMRAVDKFGPLKRRFMEEAMGLR